MPKIFYSDRVKGGNFLRGGFSGEQFGSMLGSLMRKHGEKMEAADYQQHKTDAILKLASLDQSLGSYTYNAKDKSFASPDGAPLEGDITTHWSQQFSEITRGLNGDDVNQLRQRWGVSAAGRAFGVQGQGELNAFADTQSEVGHSVESGALTREEGLPHLDMLVSSMPHINANQKRLAIQTNQDIVDKASFNLQFKENPRQAFTLLTNGVYQYSSESVRNGMLNQVRGYANEQGRWEAEKLSDAMSTSTPHSVNGDTIGLLEDLGSQKLANDLKAKNALHNNTMALLKGMPIADAMKLVNKTSIEVAGRDAGAMLDAQYMTEAVNRKMQWMLKDPLTYAVRNGDIDAVDIPQYDPSNPAAYIEDLRAFRADTAEAEGLDVSRLPLLGAEQAGQLVYSLQNTDPNQRSVMLTQFSQTLTGPELHQSAIELGAVSGSVGVAMTADPVVANQILVGETLGDSMKLPDKAKFTESFQRLTAGTEWAGSRDAVFDAAYSVYKYKKQGDPSASFDESLFESAINSVAGPRLKAGAGMVVNTRDGMGSYYDPNEFEDMWDYYQGNPGLVKLANNAMPIYYGNVESTSNDMFKFGQLVPTQRDGIYNVKKNGLYYETNGGQRYEFDIHAMMRGYKARYNSDPARQSVSSEEFMSSGRFSGF